MDRNATTAKQQRFDRWRRTLPATTRYLADLVAEHLLPAFTSRGFLWHEQATAGFLYLYQPDGDCWPAVQMRFHKRAHPMLLIDIACLPKVCRCWDGKHFAPIAREQAGIETAPVCFYLRNSRKFAPNYFGYRCFSLWPERFLRREVAAVESLLPRLFAILESGQLLDESRWPEFEDILAVSSDFRVHFDEQSHPADAADRASCNG